jgi:hypothetical protein
MQFLAILCGSFIPYELVARVRRQQQMGLKFGVELESYGLNGQEIKNAIESAGGIFGGLMGYHGTMRGGYNDSRVQGFVWTVESDSSLSDRRTNCYSMCSMTRVGTHEIVSPILHGEEGIAHMKKVMKALARAGAKVNKTCGTHVTISCVDSRWNRMSQAKTIRVARNINNFCRKYSQIIDMLVAPSRRGGTNGRSESGYCNRNSEWFEGETHYSGARTSNVNWRNFNTGNRNRSIHAQARDTRAGNRMEFRQHQGTMNGAKLANWIRLNHKIVTQFKNDGASAGTNPMGQEATFEGFCVALGLGAELKEYMIERMVNFGFMEVQ